MSFLPKIDYPIHNIQVPTTKKAFRFRPFLVKEEKLLLMAKESAAPADILTAIKQVVTNCCIDDKLDVDSISLFDLEYIFLKLRAVSVDNTVKVSFRDNNDQKVYDFEIDLNKVELKVEEQVDLVVKITDKAGLVMKYPPASLYDDKEFLELDKDYMFELIVRCIDKIYNEEEVYEAKDYKKEDLRNFLEELNVKTFEAIQDFLLKSPKLEHKLNYTNSLGENREIVLSSLNDFFTWR